MSFLPFEKYTIYSPLSAADATQKVSASIANKGETTFSPDLPRNTQQKTSTQYEGTVNGQSFSISRIIGYRNSFLPIVKGEIDFGSRGTEIHIKMRASTAVLIFMCIWLGIVGLVAILAIVGLVVSKSFHTFLLIPVGMFIFAYLLFTLAFRFESRIAKGFLDELFEVKSNFNDWLKMN
jgi:hypothetical protein